MSEKIIYLEDVGHVKVRKSKRSKNVSIALRPNTGIVLTIPYYVSYKYGLRVLEQKKEWILKHLPKIKAVEKKSTVFDETTDFKTSKRKLVISKHNSDKLKTSTSSDTLYIYYPENSTISNPEIQTIIRNVIVKTLRLEAKEYLPTRSVELAKQLNFKYNKLFIKNNKTLWGSCSGKNNINLNLHLIRLPQHLCDYVIIHELCHTVEKNHGSGFWNLMDSIVGDARKLSKELNRYSIQF